MLKNRAEKNLFISLWMAIIIAGAVWYLLPRQRALPGRQLPAVQLAPELVTLVTASVSHWEETRFELTYAPTRDYSARLGGELKDLEIQFELRTDNRTIGSGKTVLHLSAEPQPSKATLPNDDRRVPTVIFLGLPR